MKLSFDDYKDKVRACFIGKNIGGTMGTPYEGVRDLLDVKGFTTAPNIVLPNDDLDLQLVWLYALEQIGARAINSNLLGEFWLNLITPHWNEYGVGKANLRRGLTPPITGDYDNDWKNSNGAWIRTEIWSCVAPGMPVVAAKYAIEDAAVDHGAGEGTFAAIFVAVMQSSAFVISNLYRCIELGLAAIPENCRVAKTIKLVLDCYNNNCTWSECRNKVLQENSDIGDGWFEAPSNIGYTVLGLIYGEGDFKKSMLTAINCGDDTDCTAATVGATLGILYGTKGLPKDWCEHIGDAIATVSVAEGGQGRYIPKTCTELTERIVALAPEVIRLYKKSADFEHFIWKNNICDKNGKEYYVEFASKTEVTDDTYDLLKRNIEFILLPKTQEIKPNSMHFESNIIKATVTLDGNPEIKPNEKLGLTIDFSTVRAFENQQYTLNLRWILPEGFKAEGKQNLLIPCYDYHNAGRKSINATICAGETVNAENRILLEVTIPGRHTSFYISFVLFRA